MDNTIPPVDGKLVEGHVQHGARVRGYAYMTYLPPPEKEHPDFHHNCHEFTPEETVGLDTTGMPLLFNHDGNHGLLGHIMVDRRHDNGQRDAVVALHGCGNLAGEAISKYMADSLEKGRYTDVSLQHAYWIDPSDPDQVKKRALEISICRDKGRRPGAQIKVYIPASEKRSYIRPRCEQGVSCAMSVSQTSTPPQESMEVDPPASTPSPTGEANKSAPAKSTEPASTSSPSPPASSSSSPPAKDLGNMTQEELLELLVQQSERAKKLEQETERLRQFEQKKLQEEQEAERQRQLEIQKKENEEKEKLKDLTKSLLEAYNERFETQTESGETVPAVDNSLQEKASSVFDRMDAEMRDTIGTLISYASAANQDDAKRAREYQDQAQRLEREQKRLKTEQWNARFSAASSSSSSSPSTPSSSSSSNSNNLSSPASRFDNLSESVGKRILDQGRTTGLFVPKLVPKSSTPPSSSSSSPPAPSKQPQTQEEQLKAYQEWISQNVHSITAQQAEEALNRMVGGGTSAASADSGYGQPPQPLELSAKYMAPDLYSRLVQRFNRKHEHNIPKHTIEAGLPM